jgi:hypothetical protein
MKILLALVVLLATISPSLAQDEAPVVTVTVTTTKTVTEIVDVVGNVAAPPFDDDSIKAVVKLDGRLTRRVFLVLDVSGSMRTDNRISRVVQVLKHVMGQPVDDLEVAVIAFSSGFERWLGVPEPDAKPPVPVGWARLPSAIALESAQVWVSTRISAGTEPNSALKAAITEARDEVSVVFVTDGDFGGDSCVAAFREAQKTRKTAGRAEAPTLVYGVGDEAAQYEHLKTIGREGGIGFWVDKAKAQSSILPRRPN